MKKILLVVYALVFASSVCFAQSPSTPAAESPKAVAPADTLTGKVDSITLGDTAKKTKSQIVVIDDSGKATTFTVNNNIATYDKDGKQITLSVIAKGNKVLITKNDKNKVDSIKIVE